MPKLTWSEPEKRTYETGVDRGVLYPASSSGIPWNGIVAVNEAPSGGTANPFYMDGIKHLIRIESEEFGATLEAFAYPPEFEEYDGTMELVDGLYASHQRRKPFGLSYRTRIGSAANASAGYKIHIVYNAIAEPTERNYQTLSDESNLTTFNWKLSAIPKIFTGGKPTSHFVVDTTKTEPGTIAALEGLLYGTDSSAASLPDPDDLIELFTSGLPVGTFIVTNNGDGTFTMSGDETQVQTPIAGIFVLDTDQVTDNGDGTYTAVS